VAQSECDSSRGRWPWWKERSGGQKKKAQSRASIVVSRMGVGLRGGRAKLSGPERG